jgi:hypothetical protein
MAEQPLTWEQILRIGIPAFFLGSIVTWHLVKWELLRIIKKRRKKGLSDF